MQPAIKGSSARMSEGVGIRLPAMQRATAPILIPKPMINAGYSNRKSAANSDAELRVQQMVSHVQSTGHSVQITDTKQIQRSTDGTD